MKKVLRTVMRAKCAIITAKQRRIREKLIAFHVINVLKRYHRRGSGIAAYWASKDECSTKDILTWLTLRKDRVLLPFCTQEHGGMVFRRWSPHTVMVQDAMGMMAPESGSLEVPSFCLVPVVAWAPCGMRLGQGGGYYDRALSRLRMRRRSLKVLGVAFWGQQRSVLPYRMHDQNMDAIATEHGVYDCSSGQKWEKKNANYGWTFQI